MRLEESEYSSLILPLGSNTPAAVLKGELNIKPVELPDCTRDEEPGRRMAKGNDGFISAHIRRW